jgi:anthranilate/para-aminobenzoate synthase component I
MSKILDYETYQRFGKARKTSAAAPDPVAILHWLRQQGIIQAPYYLHIHTGRAEIGWQAKEHIALLDGETDTDWVAALKRIGDQAAALNSKAFGYVGFDAWDSQQGIAPDNSTTFPLVQFFIPEHRLCVEDGQMEYFGADNRLLDLALQAPPCPATALCPVSPDVGYSEQRLMQAVDTATQALTGNVTKVVLSRYLGFDYDADLLDLFAEYCLRQKYADAVLMDFGTVGAAIASPELLVKVDNGKVAANPLAGTKTRSANPAENQRIAQALLNDRKELAEHTLALVQMMSELHPHCEPGSLVINRLLDVIQQKNVMHLSSELSGELAEDKHCIDAMLSLFPSAMVSGVPKAASIELIRELEQFPRGLFAGTVGWVSGRDCRFALTIRGMYKYDKRLFVQAGAGVMAESSPAQENEEIRMKMAAMLSTLSGTSNLEHVRKAG